MHLQPSAGKPRDVGSAIIEMLYPKDTPSRIPILSITGTNGKTTVTRLVAHVIAAQGVRVGATTTDGIEIGGVRIVDGDMTGPHSARTVLSDPTVEVAVLETARGGIVRRGLGYDWSDVGVITNIQPDHFGQDGIRNADDLLFIKSLVAERVRDGGTIVLNADDPLLIRLPERPALAGRRVLYFSLDPRNAHIADHCAAGGSAIILSDGWVSERTGEKVTRVIPIDGVPLALGGWARHQIANVLAAVAACLAYGIETGDIAAALRSFAPSRQNPGRGTFYRLPEGQLVLVDYGHNPEALRATAALTRHWQGPVTAILGAPGDRSNALICELGSIAARSFDRVVLVEDHDRRGRRPGEIATLLCQAVKEAAPQRECIIVLEQPTALEAELRRSRANECIVMFYEKLAPVLDVLERFGAKTFDPIAEQEEDGVTGRNAVDRAPAPRDGQTEPQSHIARSA